MINHNYKDIAGIKHKFLLCIRDSGIRTSEGSVIWTWLCDCGNYVNRTKSYVNKISTCGNSCPLSKEVRSKSCKKVEKKLRTLPGESGLKCLYGTYKRRAKKKHIPFNLTLKQFKILTSSNCYYCNECPNIYYYNKQKNISIKSKENSKYLYNSIDQIKPNLGYTIDNVLPCCQQCNTMKWDWDIVQFKNKIKKIYKNMFLKGDSDAITAVASN